MTAGKGISTGKTSPDRCKSAAAAGLTLPDAIAGRRPTVCCMTANPVRREAGDRPRYSAAQATSLRRRGTCAVTMSSALDAGARSRRSAGSYTACLRPRRQPFAAAIAVRCGSGRWLVDRPSGRRREPCAVTAGVDGARWESTPVSPRETSSSARDLHR